MYYYVSTWNSLTVPFCSHSITVPQNSSDHVYTSTNVTVPVCKNVAFPIPNARERDFYMRMKMASNNKAACILFALRRQADDGVRRRIMLRRQQRKQQFIVLAPILNNYNKFY